MALAPCQLCQVFGIECADGVYGNRQGHKRQKQRCRRKKTKGLVKKRRSLGQRGGRFHIRQRTQSVTTHDTLWFVVDISR